MKKKPIQRFDLENIPQFQRFQQTNPQNPNIDAKQTILMYGRAIHWVSIFDVIWPDFEKLDNYSVEVAYIVVNDPDAESLPPAFYYYIAKMIAMFWEVQLTQRYSTGNWSVDIEDDPEITVRAEVHSRE